MPLPSCINSVLTMETYIQSLVFKPFDGTRNALS